MSEFSPRPSVSRSSGIDPQVNDFSSQVRDLSIDTNVLRRPGPAPSPAASISSRDSRILYAERYGLTPSMSNLNDMGEDDDDSDDDQPLRPMVPPKHDMPEQLGRRGSRPLSVRNVAPVTSTRPPVFIKPAPQQPPNLATAPADMQSTLRLYESFNQKVYFEGYLQKMNDLTADGKPVMDRHWTQWYVELCGSVLTFWDAKDAKENSETGEMEITSEEPILPTYINVTDSSVDIVGTFAYDTPARENVFVLSSAGSNRFFLQASNQPVMNRWVCAIRLACYEMTRLQEIYTRNFLARPMWADIMEKQHGKVEGWVQARFGGATEWQRYWVVVTDKRDEKRLWGKKSVASRGQLMFYENKKSKIPIITVVNILCAYAIYPENPKLIDFGTLLKVEGSMYASTANDTHGGSANAFALLMTSSNKEMVQWLMGIYDAFKLYGRPARLISDSNNINSLNFAEPVFGNQTRLFLEVGEIEHINVQNETLLDSKIAFAGVLRTKLEHQNRMPLPPPHMSGRRSSSTLLSNVTPPKDYASQGTFDSSPERPRPSLISSRSASSMRASSLGPPPPQPSHSTASFRNGGKPFTNGKRYVADSSDESDNGKGDEEEEESEDDDDNVFRRVVPAPAPPPASTEFAVASPASSPDAAPQSGLLNISGLGEPFSLSISPQSSSPDVEEPKPAPPTNTERVSSFQAASPTSKSAYSVPAPQAPVHQSEPESPSQKFEQPIVTLPINNTKGEDMTDQLTRQAVLNATARVLESGSNSRASSINNGSIIELPINKKTKKPASSLSGSEQENAYSGASNQDSEDNSPIGNTSPGYGYQRASTAKGNMTPPQMQKMKGYASPGMSGPDFEQQQQQMWETQSMMMMNQRNMYMDNDDNQSHSGFYAGRMPMYPRGYFPEDDNRSMYSNMQGGEGPAIPVLGDNFARSNSLLDQYQQEQLTAREQEEYARATGQPLIQVPHKPPEPSTGLLGLITQREQDRKDGSKAKERVSMMQAELERERMMERERRMLEQRQQQQQYLQANMMANPYGMGMMGMNMQVPMMDPRMSMMSGMSGMAGMGGGMTGMNGMNGMMDPRMSMMSGMGMNPMAMGMNPMAMGMNPMMLDPRMAMMNNPYMRNSGFAGSMYGGFGGAGSVAGSRYGGLVEEDDDDDDEEDNIPIGKVANNQDIENKNLRPATSSSTRDSHSSNSSSNKSRQSIKEA
ncbi:hypothetical protein NQZ79_g314 [Umbelopsis isabellina]|nr:hypothetical protein NQZ79_g314 [Umbelopsis isabellina]